MPARFRLFDSGPDKGADRYFLVDSRPYSPEYPRGPWRAALSFNKVPYHPSYGIGLSVELDSRDWGQARMRYFRNWGKRIKLDDMDARDAVYCAVDFVCERLDEGSADRAALAAFLAENGRSDDLLAQVHANRHIERILHQLLHFPRIPEVSG